MSEKHLLHFQVDCCDKDLHSGVFGGSVHEAMTDLIALMGESDTYIFLWWKQDQLVGYKTVQDDRDFSDYTGISFLLTC